METITQVTKPTQQLRVGEVAEKLARAYDGHAETLATEVLTPDERARVLEECERRIKPHLLTVLALDGEPVSDSRAQKYARLAVRGVRQFSEFRAERVAFRHVAQAIDLILLAIVDTTEPHERDVMRKLCKRIAHRFNRDNFVQIATSSRNAALLDETLLDYTEQDAEKDLSAAIKRVLSPEDIVSALETWSAEYEDGTREVDFLKVRNYLADQLAQDLPVDAVTQAVSR